MDFDFLDSFRSCSCSMSGTDVANLGMSHAVSKPQSWAATVSNTLAATNLQLAGQCDLSLDSQGMLFTCSNRRVLVPLANIST